MSRQADNRRNPPDSVSRPLRRTLLNAAALSTVLGWRQTLAAARSRLAFVGTYTPNGGGIYSFDVDPVTGAMHQRELFEGIRNPSWITINPAGMTLYAVSEVDDFGDDHSGAVVSFAIDRSDGKLTKLGTVSSGGANPAHMSVHPSGKYVFVGNYSGGSVAVFPVEPDGSLGAVVDIKRPSGPLHPAFARDDPKGQFGISDHASSHVHMVQSDPRGGFVIANDAGLDQTLIWHFDAMSGRLEPAAIPLIDAPPGSAPRHFAFHPDGHTLYNVHEHDSQLIVYSYDGNSGTLTERQTLSALPPRFAGSNLSSEILVSPDGRFVYVANRLHDGITIFKVRRDGNLEPVSDEWVRADYPRGLCIDPAGRFLYSCNQKGDSITSFRIDPRDGLLRFTGNFEPVGSPAVMAFLGEHHRPTM
jgi:6-phosphogluconolactonase